MATTEHIALFSTKDSSGNKKLVYPVTTLDAVEGLPESWVTFETQTGEEIPTSNTYKYQLSDEEKAAAVAAVLSSFETEEWTFELEDGTTVTKRVPVMPS